MKLAQLPVIGQRLAARPARLRYFASGAQAERLLDRLQTRKAAIPTERARILSAWAELERSMADHNAQGWKPDALRTETITRHVTATHETTAELLHLIASTEVADGAYNRARGPAEWEDAFGDVLDELAIVTDPGTRSDLLNRLYRHAYRTVGRDVAETITALRRAYNYLALHQAANFATPDGSPA